MKILIILAILLQSIAYATGPKTDAIQAAVNYVFDQEDNAEKAQEVILQILLSSNSSVDFSNSINIVNQYIQKREISQRNEFNYIELNSAFQTFCSNLNNYKIKNQGILALATLGAFFSTLATIGNFQNRKATLVSKLKYAIVALGAVGLPSTYLLNHNSVMDNVNYPSHMDHNLPSVCN